MIGKKDIFPNDFEKCPKCNGKGKLFCYRCNGRGYTERTVYRYDYTGQSDPETEMDTCTKCFGSGEYVCDECGGTGDKRIEKDIIDPITDSLVDTSETKPLKDLSQLKEEYKESYQQRLYEADVKRESLNSWVMDRSGFSYDYRMKFTNWLNSLSFDDPKTEESLKATISDVTGSSTQEGTFRLMLTSLADICNAINFYKGLMK